MREYLLTSESVSEGHPDKVADQIFEPELFSKKHCYVFKICIPDDILARCELKTKTFYGRIKHIRSFREKLFISPGCQNIFFV